VAVGAERVSEHEGVEPIVLAGSRLMPFTRPSRHAWTDREHDRAGGMESVDEYPIRPLDRRADQIRQLDESCDQRVDTVAGVGVPLVEHLDPGVVDCGDLMVGGHPSRCQRTWACSPPRSLTHRVDRPPPSPVSALAARLLLAVRSRHRREGQVCIGTS
jgi:hypothetical protein